MKTPAERGPLGAWAYESRLDADLTPEQVVQRLAALGHRVTAPTIRGIEGGSKTPGHRLLRLLAEVYGRPPPGEPAAPPPAEALIAALGAQTAAITALVEELRLGRVEQAGWNRAIEAAIRESLAATRADEHAPRLRADVQR